MTTISKTKKTFKALYYPFIEVNDKSWLMSAILFWDKISTITPNVSQPYSSHISRELYDSKILVPLRVNPDRIEIARVSEKISEYIANPHFMSLIGEGHWAIMQSRDYPIHSDKIASNLLHELERLGKATKRENGFVDMKGGLAAAYMLLLSQEIAQRNKFSLVTDTLDAFQASEYARFPDVNRHDRFLNNPRNIDNDQIVFVDACINEMIIKWFKISPQTDVKKIIKFRKNRKDELLKMKMAIIEANLNILSDTDHSIQIIQEKARNYVQGVVQPSYDI